MRHGTLRSLARILAASEDDAVRDGPRALDLATKACGLTDWNDAKALEVLAAAYAEVGSFDEAIKWQEKVVESMSMNQGQAEAKQHLELYRAHRPLRE